MLDKICPTCGTENNSSEMMCGRCMADISAVLPEEKKIESPISTKKTKLYIEHNGNSVEINSGDIFGREFSWSSYLQDFMTISRKHLSFIYKEDKWFVKDEGSSNGTYVNGEDIRGKGEIEIKAGDKLSISKSFTANIKGEA